MPHPEPNSYMMLPDLCFFNNRKISDFTLQDEGMGEMPYLMVEYRIDRALRQRMRIKIMIVVVIKFFLGR